MILQFVSTNKKKLNDFTNCLAICPDHNLTISGTKLVGGTKISDFVEIQSTNPKEIVADKLRQLMTYELDTTTIYLVEDTSLYIDILNGHPGTYIKDFYATVGPKTIVKLFGGSSVNIVSCIGILYYQNDVWYTYITLGTQKGRIVDNLSDNLSEQQLSDFDCIICPENSTSPFIFNDERTFRSDAFKDTLKFITESI